MSVSGRAAAQLPGLDSGCLGWPVEILLKSYCKMSILRPVPLKSYCKMQRRSCGGEVVSVSGRAAAASAKVSVWGRGRVCQWAGGGVAAAVTRRRRSGAAAAARWRGGSVSQQGGECQRAGSAAAAAARRRGRSMLERGGECQRGGAAAPAPARQRW